MKLLNLFLIGALPIFFQFCTANDDDPLAQNCDYTVVVDADAYDNTTSDDFILDSVYIKDMCLHITLSSSGCDGHSWRPTLIDADAVMESYPVQRNLRFVLENNELCEAFISKTYSFDLKPIQINNYESIILNIATYKQQLTYNY